MSRLKLLGTVALTMGLLAGGGTAASAAVTPTPADSPTVSPSIGIVPTPAPAPRLQRETFIVQLAQAGNVVLLNRVAANGPVSGIGSDDLTLSPRGWAGGTLSQFRLPSLLRSVNVPHTGIAAPSVNLRLCTASVTQTGLWRFAGGTGLFRFARGSGLYQLVGQWWFPRLRNGACSLLFLRGNPLLQHRIAPTYQTVSVVGTGTARI